MMKFTGNNMTKRHVIHFEEWPIDCLVRYLEKNQRLLLHSIAPKIMADISALSIGRSGRMGWIRELDDLFTSCVNRLVIQTARQDQNLTPYLYQLIVATERRLPFNTGIYSVLFDCIDSIKQDHAVQRRIFELMYKSVKQNETDSGNVFCPQLISAIQTFEKELFHVLDLQRQVLFPKIYRMASQS